MSAFQSQAMASTCVRLCGAAGWPCGFSFLTPAWSQFAGIVLTLLSGRKGAAGSLALWVSELVQQAACHLVATLQLGHPDGFSITDPRIAVLPHGALPDNITTSLGLQSCLSYLQHHV